MADVTEVSKFEIEISLLTERFGGSHLSVSLLNSLNFTSIV